MYTGVRKVVQNIQLEVPLTDPGFGYGDLCYAGNGTKERQLLRNYWPEALAEAAITKLIERKDSEHTSVAIALQGEKKDSRSQGYCMQSLVLTQTRQAVSAHLFYRSTESIQKFAADLLLFSELLPPIFERLEWEAPPLQFTFANVYCSAMFMPILLRYHPDPMDLFLRLRDNDPKFFRVCALSTRRYFNPEHNYTYRTRVKMFEYWKNHIDENKLTGLRDLLENI